MTQALSAAPEAPPRRTVLVGTALACLSGTMLVGGMLAIWVWMRNEQLDTGEPWVPSGVSIPGVPANVILISFAALLLFAHWAVYAAKQRDRLQVGLALGTTALVAAAIINAQAYLYQQMELPLADETAYGPMFYSVTGLFLLLVVVGLVFTAVSAFRYLGGRSGDHDVMISHALYWYFVGAAYAAIWFVVYVTK